MVDREVFDRRLATLQGITERLRDAGEIALESFVNDPTRRAAVERWSRRQPSAASTSRTT